MKTKNQKNEKGKSINQKSKQEKQKPKNEKQKTEIKNQNRKTENPTGETMILGGRVNMADGVIKQFGVRVIRWFGLCFTF